MSSTKVIAATAAIAIAAAGGAAVATSSNGSSPQASTASISSPTHAKRVSDDQSTAKQVYNSATNSVAYIQAQTSEGTATGTGFVVDSGGLIVTNNHVVDGATQVQLKLGTGGKAQAATVVGVDASKDLALLKISTSSKLPALKLGDSSTVQVGDSTYAIGNPYGLDHTLTTGVVSALHRDIQAPDGATINDVIQTDAAINPGNSGGPLLDNDGNVIGVNSQIVSSGGGSAEGGSVGIGFAIPSNTVKTFVEQAKSGKLSAQPQTQQQDPSQQQVDPSQQGVDPSQQGVDPSQQGVDPSQQGVDPSQQLQEQLQQQLEQQQGGSGDQSQDPYGDQSQDPSGQSDLGQQLQQYLEQLQSQGAGTPLN